MPAGDDSPGVDAAASALERTDPLRMGAGVLATDGECGELVRVIVNPVAQTLTHLVVDPRHDGGENRLVPIDLVESVDDDHTSFSRRAMRGGESR